MAEPAAIAVRHEFDSPPGLAVQELQGRLRVVVFFRCARCGRFSCMGSDIVPPLVLGPD